MALWIIGGALYLLAGCAFAGMWAASKFKPIDSIDDIGCGVVFCVIFLWPFVFALGLGIALYGLVNKEDDSE